MPEEVKAEVGYTPQHEELLQHAKQLATMRAKAADIIERKKQEAIAPPSPPAEPAMADAVPGTFVVLDEEWDQVDSAGDEQQQLTAFKAIVERRKTSRSNPFPTSS